MQELVHVYLLEYTVYTRVPVLQLHATILLYEYTYSTRVHVYVLEYYWSTGMP